MLALLYKDKSPEKKERILRLFAYLTIGLYVADFFLMPLSDSYDRISIDKLPFHICTLTGVMIPFVQFNPRFAPVKEAVVSLAMTSSLMWMCYPGTALGGQPPFCYLIFQTFMYHGLMFCWGFLNLTLGAVKLHWKEFWKPCVGVLLILVWSMLGNALYDNQNWFFTKYSIFPFLTDKIMPPVVVFCVCGVCFLIYCLYFGICALANRKAKETVTAN